MGIVWHPIKCGYCLCSFLVIGTRFNKRRQFCSRKCAGLFKIGKHHSGGNKIREALQGVPKSKAHIEKVRMALTGRIRLNMRGEKNHNWTGGGILTEQIRKCTRNKEWKVKCLIRDGRQCVKCFENKQSELEIDHIIPFSFLLKEYNVTSFVMAEQCDMLWDINNGQTLCRRCHKKTDTYGERAKKWRPEAT